jgi:hypothetical protein
MLRVSTSYDPTDHSCGHDGLPCAVRRMKSLMVLLRLILCTGIRPSIGTENLIPEEVNYTKITIRVTVMNKVQFDGV